MRYELFYWPSIQGRGEFVRLALEEAGADYIDVGRHQGRGLGVEAIMRMMKDPSSGAPPFAPPFLRVGKLVIAQTAHILQYLGPRLNLAPRAEAKRLWAHQLQLTIMDFIAEIHDVHHPIGSGLYYEQQKPEALRRSANFTTERMPRFLGYFEHVLARNPAARGYMVGRSLSYVDLSIFQVVSGLRYAFPETMARCESKTPGLVMLAVRIAQRPNLAAYLDSDRRIPFNEEGIFRHYPELDVQTPSA